MKRTGKKILVSLLAVLLLFSSIPIASAATTVTQLTLKACSGVTYMDEDGYPFSEEDNDYYAELGFQVAVEENGGITVTPAQEGKGLQTFKFALEVKPDTGIEGFAPTATGGAGVSLLGANTYSVSFRRATAAEVAVDLNPQKAVYNVNLPADGTGYRLEAAGNTVVAGEKFSFDVVMEDGYAAPAVKVNNVLTSASAVNGNTYTYTLSNVQENKTVTVSASKKNYTVAFGSHEGYTVTPNAGGTIEHGGTFNFYVTPEAGYDKPIVTATNGTVQSLDNNTLYQLSGVTADTQINVESVKAKRNITLTAGANYQFTNVNGDVISNQTVNDGESFSFKVAVDASYDVTVTSSQDGVLTAVDGVYTIASVKNDTTISVVLSKKTFRITEPESLETDAYTYTANASTTVEYGGSFSFYAIPKMGYQAPKVLVNGKELSSPGNNLYTITNIQEAKTISITEGDVVSYQVTLNQGTGYSIVPKDGATAVEYGKDFKFKVELSPEYSQSAITVTANNINLTMDSEGYYTIASVKEDQVVSVSGVSKNTYRVTLKNGTGYTLSTTQFTTGISHGSTFSFSMNVAQGYNGSKAVVMAGSEILKPENGVYSFIVTGDTEVTVTGVAEETYTVSVSSGNGYTVNALEGSDSSVHYNGSYAFTVSVKPGYQLEQVVVNNAPLSPLANGEYHINNITADQNVQVFVREITYTVIYEDEVGGTSRMEYTVADADVSGKIVLKTPDVQQYYSFDGWYNASGEQQTEFILGNKDETLTVTAKRTPLWDQIVNLIFESNQKPSDQENSQNLLYHLGIEVANILATQDAKITGCGILYSNRELTQDELQGRIANITDRETMDQKISQNVGDKVLAYYYNTNYNVSDLKTLNQTFLKVANGSYRSACGWIELTVNGEKLVFTSNIISQTIGAATEE